MLLTGWVLHDVQILRDGHDGISDRARVAIAHSDSFSYPVCVREGLGAPATFAYDIDMVHAFSLNDEATMAWIAEKMNVESLTPPDLSSFGLSLVGLRLSETKKGPAVQMLYKDAAIRPVRVVLTRYPDGEGIKALLFRIHKEGMVGEEAMV